MNAEPHPLLRVRDVMTSPAITVLVTSTFSEIVACLLDHDISGVPVVDAAECLVGVVSESDLMLRDSGTDGRPANDRALDTARTAADLMNPRTVTATLDETLPVFVRRMLATSVNRLPVLRDGTLVGVISRHDVLRSFEEIDHL